MAQGGGKRGPVFMPGLEGPSTRMVNALARGQGRIGNVATLLKVFLPYLVWNTVFDNSRVVEELGRTPAPFSIYSYPLLAFSRASRFSYEYRGWPGTSAPSSAAQGSSR